RVRGDGHGEIEVAAAAADAGALAGHAHPLARLHTGRDLHVELPPRPLPAAASAGRARLAADVAGAVTGGAGLVHLQGEGFAGAGERFLQGDLDAGLNVVAAAARLAAAWAAATAEQGLEIHATAIAAPTTRAGSAAAAKIPEDRAEEVGEIAAIAALVLDAEPAARLTGSLLGVALPVGAERVVAAALLRIGEYLVRLVDLLEAIGRVLALGDVGMVLAGQPAEGGLDRLVVGLPVDAEDLVVVLEFDGHGGKRRRSACSAPQRLQWKCSRRPERRRRRSGASDATGGPLLWSSLPVGRHLDFNANPRVRQSRRDHRG